VTSPERLVLKEEVGSGGLHWLILAGVLDLASAPGLEARIERLCVDGASVVVLDLSKLTFMDSTGLQAVLAATKRCAVDGLELVLTGATGAVQRLFELTGVRSSDRLVGWATDARALGIEDGRRGAWEDGLTPDALFERLTGVRPVEDLGDLVEALAESYEDGRRAGAAISSGPPAAEREDTPRAGRSPRPPHRR
jgi:anti-sigma B factor antagonist